MAEFTVLVLKIAFLAILWLFIIMLAAVVNSDMQGRRQKKRKGDQEPEPAAYTPPGAYTPPAPPRPAKQKKHKKEPWILAIDSGIHAGDRLQLVPEVHIGRSEACELVLDDDYVSSMHALLSNRADGRWVLQDLGSTNGTYVNSHRISEPTLVGIDDVIRIGDIQMRLEF